MRFTNVVTMSFLFLLAAFSVQGQVIINEVDADNPGTDDMEFVELFGQANLPLDGMVVIFYNGNGDVSYQAFDLDGHSLDANGYFVLGNAAVANVDLVFTDNILQNGTDAVALYTGNNSDFPNGTPVTTNNLIDAFVYDTGDADDTGLINILLNMGQPQVDEGNDNGLYSNQRCPNGSGGARNTNTYYQFEPTPGTSNGCDATDIRVTKTNGDTIAVAGTNTTYTIVVANSGPNDDNMVSLVDVIPAGLICTYTSFAIGGASGNTAVGSGNLGETLSLPTGSMVTYTCTCNIVLDTIGTIINMATIYSSIGDTSSLNNIAIDTTRIILPAMVPTIGQWGLIILSLLMVVIAVVQISYIQNKKTKSNRFKVM